MIDHFTFDHVHGGASDSGHWNAGGSGTFHGNQTDVHVGGNIVDHGGHFDGGVSGGITVHSTPNVDVGFGGYVNSGGSGGGQVSISGHW